LVEERKGKGKGRGRGRYPTRPFHGLSVVKKKGGRGTQDPASFLQIMMTYRMKKSGIKEGSKSWMEKEKKGREEKEESCWQAYDLPIKSEKEKEKAGNFYKSN